MSSMVFKGVITIFKFFNTASDALENLSTQVVILHLLSAEVSLGVSWRALREALCSIFYLYIGASGTLLNFLLS